MECAGTMCTFFQFGLVSLFLFPNTSRCFARNKLQWVVCAIRRFPYRVSAQCGFGHNLVIFQAVEMLRKEGIGSCWWPALRGVGISMSLAAFGHKVVSMFIWERCKVKAQFRVQFRSAGITSPKTEMIKKGKNFKRYRCSLECQKKLAEEVSRSLAINSFIKSQRSPHKLSRNASGLSLFPSPLKSHSKNMVFN